MKCHTSCDNYENHLNIRYNLNELFVEVIKIWLAQNNSAVYYVAWLNDT